MSNLLSQASLVMIPSGYKEDVVYSQIPTNGNGDLSFTRASNGTRVNSAGLVEDLPWNLLSYSEDFSNGDWLKTNMTVVSNNATAPNGTLTADKITATAANAAIANFLIQSTVIYTLSVYVKSATGSNVDAKIGGQSSSATFTSFTATNEWTLVTCSVLSLGGNRGSQIQIINSGDSLYVWGAQLNIGSTAKPYFPTTDRLNVPRLTYQNGGGGCPSLLLEKQSTNLALWSNAMATSPWTTYNGTTTDNETISPDGTQNATKVIMGAGNSATIRQTIGGLSNGQPYTFSLYIKQGSGVTAFLDISDTAGTVNITPTSEWVRYTYTANWNTSLNFVDIELRGTSGSAFCYIWGAQLEAGSYATSVIYTTSSSATRVADAIGNQTTSIVQAFTDNTKGTIFFDLKNIKFQGGAEARFQFGDSADSLRFAFFMDAVGLGVYGYQGGGYAVNVSTATNQKIAIRFDGTSLTGFSQGVKRNTVTSGTNYVIEQMVGNNTANLCFEMNEFVLFNSVLTDAECIALTT